MSLDADREVFRTIGREMSLADLDVSSRQAARLLRYAGLRDGDAVAICLPNSAEFMVAVSGAARAGLCVASISSRLTSAEIDDIVRGAEAKALVITAAIGPAFGELPARLPGVVLFATGGAVAGFRDWDRERQAQSTEPLAPGGPCRHH